METVVLLAVSRYDFKDGDRHIQGVTCQYVSPLPVQGDPNKRGYPSVDIPGTLELYDAVHELPGIYRLEVGLRPGPKHKPIPTVVGLQYIGKARVGPEKE